MSFTSTSENLKLKINPMEKKKSNVERDLREEMFRQKYYNEKPIKGYNHLTGTLDSKIKSIPHEVQVYNVNPEVRSLCESEY